ncbi:MAG: hypothetical protein JO279_14140 [Verrucomicrobia bacterium]|nr:hypothetical protein [Verrucomicrobiota bacterium]
MKKITAIGLAFGASVCIGWIAQADEIQFTTLPQTVQTTVVRETHIANPTYVTRVVRDQSGIYAVTVRGNSGDQVVYVNPEGALVQAPGSATTTTTTTRTVEQPATTTTTVQRPVQTVQPAEGTVVTYDQVQQNLPRYQLIEKKGKKEIYYDRQTGQKVIVKRENR